MATDHYNLKKTETCLRACLKSIFYIVLNFAICMTILLQYIKGILDLMSDMLSRRLN